MDNTTEERDELLTVKELCELCRVSKRTVYRWLEQGKIRGLKAGGQWRFTYDAVVSMLTKG